MTAKRILVLCLFMVFAISCEGRKDENVEYNKKTLIPNELIRDAGDYVIQSEHEILKVRIRQKRVSYNILNQKGDTLLSDNKPSISSAHKWGLLLDENGSLWIQSSDIGLYVAKKKDNSNYEIESFGKISSQNIDSVPDKIYSIFSRSLKEKYQKSVD